MSWHRFLDPLFPVVEPFTPAEREAMDRRRQDDLDAIAAEDWSPDEARALDEAQRIAAAEQDRVKTAESKASTYLATLAALIPLVLTIEGSYWERKSGPAPEWIKLVVLAIATIHVAAAGYHAFRALQVSAFQRITEGGLVDAWRSKKPMRQLTRETLAATRASRDAVNAKVTRVKITQAHLTRAFAAFIALMLLDPAFRAFGAGGRAAGDDGHGQIVVDRSSRTSAGACAAEPGPATPRSRSGADTVASSSALASDDHPARDSPPAGKHRAHSGHALVRSRSERRAPIGPRCRPPPTAAFGRPIRARAMPRPATSAT